MMVRVDAPSPFLAGPKDLFVGFDDDLDLVMAVGVDGRFSRTEKGMLLVPSENLFAKAALDAHDGVFGGARVHDDADVRTNPSELNRHLLPVDLDGVDCPLVLASHGEMGLLLLPRVHELNVEKGPSEQQGEGDDAREAIVATLRGQDVWFVGELGRRRHLVGRLFSPSS